MTQSKAAKAKKNMRCGEVRESYKKEKKKMQKVCEKKADGVKSERIIHAGDSRYSSNTTPKQRKKFTSRHGCKTAKKNTPKKLACDHIWGPKSKKYIGTDPQKRYKEKK